MPRRRSTLRLGRRFAGIPGGRKGRRTFAKAFTGAFRATGGGWSPKVIRKVLRAAGVRFN